MREEHGRLMFQWLIPFAFAAVVILIMFFNFSNKIKQEAIETVESRLEEVAEKNALKVSNDLESIRAAGETAAQVIGKQKSSDSQVTRQLLEAVVENTQISEAVYYDRNQNAVDHKGNRVNLEGTDYIDGLQNNVGVKYYFEKYDSIAGTSVILIIIPVEGNGGSFLLYYPMERLNEITQLSEEFDQSAFATIITPEGYIFQSENIKSNFVNGENIWENVNQGYQSDATKARVRMQNKNTGCVELAAENEERTLVYAPIGVDDWMFIIGVNQSYVDYNQEYIFSNSIRRLYQLLSVMFLFIVVFAATNYIGRIRNAEKSKNLQEKADTDLLTGLNNKLATERKIKEYISKNPNSLAMMFVLDIDNFKKINDTMGHAFGDEVLRSFGKQIGANFRVTDIIGRTGGDEFTIFLKNLQNDDNTLKEAQKLEYFFKNFQVGEYVKYSATASIGAAVFPADGEDFEALYKSADQALYKAKKRGKNQIAFYDDRDRQKQTVQSDQ